MGVCWKKATASLALAALVFACAGLLAAAPGVARATQDGVETVRVGYYENEVFEEGAQEGAVKTGYAYEYYRKLSEYTGWQYEYVYGSFGDLYQMLLDGEVDLLAGLAYKEDRAQTIGYPDLPMGSESYSLVKHAADTDTTTDPSTLDGKKIGVLDSAIAETLDKYIDGHQVKADVVRYQDYSDLFTAFDAGELDLMAAEGDGAYGRDDVEVLLVFGASDYYLCTSVSRPDLLEQLNAAQELLGVEEPNYLNSLRMKYYASTMSARAFSEAEREWLGENSTLQVGYLENYLPYSDTGEDGQVTGLVKDVLSKIFESLGIADVGVEYRGYGSYDDMVADMNSGVIDVAFPVGGGLYYSEENGINQSNPVVSAPTELVLKGDYTDETTSSIAVNENNRMQYYYVRTNYPDASITFYPTIDDCLHAVLAGEVNCTTLNGLRANDILRNNEYKNLTMHQTNKSDDRCFGVEIGNKGLLKLLNRGINVIGADYAQNQSYRYTGGLYEYNLADMVQDNLAVFVAAFAILVALIILHLVNQARQRERQVQEKEAARQELESKNNELAESQRALSEALDAAENANRAKTTFLNNMSHDIRTPMNAIMGFTALAKEHIDDKDQVGDYLQKISVSSRHLLSLINDVLDMSRIESGKMTLEEADVHLPDIVRDLGTIIQSGVASKRIEFTSSMDGIVHEDVITDRLRLNQVLLNILGNAVKFTPDGGHVELRVAELSSESEDIANYEFVVKDDGIGMSEEFQKTVFEAFTREQTSTISGIQGTGLGMAITKEIVDMMGGTIAVSSQEGVGSEFIVRIPFKVAAASSPDDAVAVEVSASDISPQAQPQLAQRDFSGKRVLLVEDNEMNQIIATTILQEHGFEVDLACDGVEAVEKMRQAPAGRYDAVLMDVQMPRMDGYEATRRIRALDDAAKAGVPIVAVTANAFEEDANMAREAGMDGHLAKPYDVPTMMETLNRLIPQLPHEM